MKALIKVIYRSTQSINLTAAAGVLLLCGFAAEAQAQPPTASTQPAAAATSPASQAPAAKPTVNPITSGECWGAGAIYDIYITTTNKGTFEYVISAGGERGCGIDSFGAAAKAPLVISGAVSKASSELPLVLHCLDKLERFAIETRHTPMPRRMVDLMIKGGSWYTTNYGMTYVNST